MPATKSAVKVVTASGIDQAELEVLRAVAARLPAASPLRQLLADVAQAISLGVDVAVVRSDKDLTPNQAAEIAQVSRPFLVKMMDRGLLRFHMVGSNRRVKTSDLLDYLRRRDEASEKLAHTLAHAEEIRQAQVDELVPVDPALKELSY